MTNAINAIKIVTGKKPVLFDKEFISQVESLLGKACTEEEDPTLIFFSDEKKIREKIMIKNVKKSFVIYRRINNESNGIKKILEAQRCNGGHLICNFFELTPKEVQKIKNMIIF